MIREEKGQTIVEWALILPIFLILFIGLIDFGWAFSKQHSLNQVAKELARSASIGENVDDLKLMANELAKTILTPDTITHDEVDNNTIFTITDTNGKEVKITFIESLNNREKGKDIKVRIEYEYQPFTPFVNATSILLSAEYMTKAETGYSTGDD
jgi:Flp pilus assembly protein TadG